MSPNKEQLEHKHEPVEINDAASINIKIVSALVAGAFLIGTSAVTLRFELVSINKRLDKIEKKIGIDARAESDNMFAGDTKRYVNPN